MTDFYIRTDQSVAGPFTGVELREAALAGILRPDAAISSTTKGPWVGAMNTGLFSEKKQPLPHPCDVAVPQYQVRGMPGAFQGPFKLRELIGFAARGMLPAGALLQSDPSGPWIPAHRFRILSACLGGDLVLIDASGKVVLRTSVTSGSASGNPQARAPIEITKAAGTHGATSNASSLPQEDPSDLCEPIATASLAFLCVDPTANSTNRDRGFRLIPRLLSAVGGSALVRSIARPRLVLAAVCLLALVFGINSAYSSWKQMRMPRGRVLGQWIGVAADGAESSQARFGISFAEDGRCVIFNTHAQSWTGDFLWADRTDDEQGFTSIAPLEVDFDEVEPNHTMGVIKPSDGYIELQGFVKEAPLIDGHPVRNFFVRREGQRLRIGYLTRVQWTEQAKLMQAGWITAVVQPPAAPIQLPVAEPSQINATQLLETYGVPDEARRLYAFERPPSSDKASAADWQFVRYGSRTFILSSDGTIQNVQTK